MNTAFLPDDNSTVSESEKCCEREKRWRVEGRIVSSRQSYSNTKRGRPIVITTGIEILIGKKVVMYDSRVMSPKG